MDTFLVQGDGSDPTLRTSLNDLASSEGSKLDAVLLFSLGANHNHLLSAVSCSGIRCPVFLSETYGIIGFDKSIDKNIELMEKGRGTEYGCRGGDGGQGVVVVAFRGGTIVATHEAIPDGSLAVLVLTSNSSPQNFLRSFSCLYYGGVSKANYVLAEDKFTSVENILVASAYGEGAGLTVASVTEDISKVVIALKVC